MQSLNGVLDELWQLFPYRIMEELPVIRQESGFWF
jgi:hypothetical protein